tara:strand:+ start:2852 stop:3094 length:243 start_codon:yes stop_codon:yes gene_type:complete
MEEEEEELWRLTKKVMEEGPGRCFIFDSLDQSEEHERQIPKFKKELESMDLEIFTMKGHQFMTSEGVYRIVKKINDTQYE